MVAYSPPALPMVNSPTFSESQVDQDAALQHAGLQARGAVQPIFFIHGE